MTCKEIEKRLPAYLEDLLSPEEKQDVEDHLASCLRCCETLADLKRTQTCLEDLDEVEPPPFLEQRIMARVREEAEQKQGILRKLFRPLYIKIPIQALATLLVAVVAIYIYQKGEPEMKRIVPLPIPITESDKDRTAMESPKIRTAPSADAPSRQASAGNSTRDHRPRFVSPPLTNDGKSDQIDDPRATIRKERSSAIKPDLPTVSARKKEAEPIAVEGLYKAQVGTAKQVTGRTLETLRSDQKRKQSMADAGETALKSETMRLAPAPSRMETQTAAKPSSIDLTLQTGNRDTAIREIERHLGPFNATIIERQHLDEKDILKVDLAAQNVDAFLTRLGTIGRVKSERSLPPMGDGQVTLRISIVGHP